ncbi:hypothetical protein [Parvibaculum sp.]|uniref:hypothetical protein n=1 Tax=Parvibaculum sp. TaxID=2024848 RepID=UPI00391AA0D6
MSELLLRPERIRLKNDAGHTVFSTDLPMMAVLASYTGTLNLPSHAPELSYTATHQTDHLIGAVPPAADRVLAWGQLSDPSDYIPANRPFDLSGGVVLTGNAVKFSGYAQQIYLWQCLQPLVSGGNLYLRETWFNHRSSSPAYAGVTIPAISIDYNLRAVAFVGGS